MPGRARRRVTYDDLGDARVRTAAKRRGSG